MWMSVQVNDMTKTGTQAADKMKTDIQPQFPFPGSSARRRVVVVGGGALGCAIAYRAARAGLAVTLLERDAIGAHASGCNAGNLNPLYATPPSLLTQALDAFKLHHLLAEELRSLGCARYALHPVTRILIGSDAAERAALEQAAELFGATPRFSSRWLEREALRRAEPGIAENVEFGVQLEGSRSVDGQLFTRSLADAAVRLGCELVLDAAVGVTSRADRVTGVRTGRGVLACDEVVFAMGPWVSELQSWLDIEMAVEPLKGQLLLVQLPKQEQPLHDLSWKSVAIYRRRDAQIWIGGTMEKSGFDVTPTDAVRAGLLADAARIFPAMNRATVIRHVAALRPSNQSDRPIAARAGGWGNAWIANGGGAKGILLSVGIAQTIVELMAGRGNALVPAGE